MINIILRPHHFLCLKGYKGFNYSTKQVENWDSVVNVLLKNPDTDIFIASGKDSLCRTCPLSSGATKRLMQCLEQNIQELDDKIRILLGIEAGKKYRYSDVVEIMNQKVTKEKHQELCSKCLWWRKGLCQDSFEKSHIQNLDLNKK